MISRICWRTGVVIVFLIGWSLADAAEDIVFRTSIAPEDSWVGQQVRLRVDVLAKDGWAQLKKISKPEVEGAYMMRLETQGTRLNETIEGDAYSGQRYQFMLYTQRGGNFVVPSFPVDVEVRRYGADGGTSVERMSVPPVTFSARTPPGAERLKSLVSTSAFAASQDWSSEIDEAVAGDSITRTITLEAADVSAMAFAPLVYPDMDSVAVYAGLPAVDDRFNRGRLTGTRIETVTYVFERPGKAEIPGVSLTWWDVRQETLKRVELPGMSLQVVPNPANEAFVDAAPGPDSGDRIQWYAGGVIAALVAIWFLFAGRIAARLQAWRRARAEHESAYFRKALAAGRRGDKAAFLRDTMRWLDRINDNSLPARLDQFLERYGNSDNADTLRKLSAATTPVMEKQAIRDLAAELETARKQFRKSEHAKVKSAALLPELNG